MPPGEFNDLRDFCFRHLEGENAADAHAVAMDMQHHLDRLLAVLLPKNFSRIWTTNSIGV